jgi:hypothetical protein
MERKQQNSVSTDCSLYKISERHIYIPEVLGLPVRHDIALVRIPIATRDMQSPLKLYTTTIHLMNTCYAI